GALANASYIVAAELDGQRPESRVFLAATVTIDEIREEFGDQITTRDVVEFDDASATVIARRREELGAIALRDVAISDPDPDVVRRALVDEIVRRGMSSLPWSDAAVEYRDRLAFAARHDTTWPNVSDAALAARLDEWLT